VFRGEGIEFHALRTRQAGRRRFVTVHVLVPGRWTVSRGHDLLERVEAQIAELAPRTTVLTHLEPREDPLSYRDQDLDRLDRE
jgi:divalent metal cation (Fe/Co/Zn/Cd) transporter